MKYLGVFDCVETTQKFEVDLDGAQTLRVLCYSQQNSVDSLLGKGAIEVNTVTNNIDNSIDESEVFKLCSLPMWHCTPHPLP